MRSLWTIVSLAAIVLATACGADKGKEQSDAAVDDTRSESAPSDAGVDAAVLAEKEDRFAEAEKQREKDLADPEAPAYVPALVEELREHRRALNVREREIVRREQSLARLELSTLMKTGELNQVKSEVNALLTQLKDKYKVQIEKYEALVLEQKKTAEAKNKKKAAEQKEKAEEIAAEAAKLRQEREERIAHLVKTIKGMRPDAGGSLVASMDDDDAVAVLRQIGSRQAAGLLGAMPAGKAAKLAQKMLGPKAPESGIFEEPLKGDSSDDRVDDTSRAESD